MVTTYVMQSAPLALIDRPSPPQNLVITGYTKDTISVSWSAPDCDGGAPLTSYVVERQDTKRKTWMTAGSAGPDTTDYTINKLIEGNEYVIRVFAENRVGASEPVETDSVTAKNPFGEFIWTLLVLFFFGGISLLHIKFGMYTIIHTFDESFFYGWDFKYHFVILLSFL